MNNLDKTYTDLLKDILENGTQKGDRTGTGTISVFGRQIRHKMSEGFPLLTTKKMYFKGIVTELLWFLRGDTNIKYLVDNNCHIWDGDAYKKYHTTWEMDTYGVLDALSQEGFINKIKTNRMFAFEWGELGPIYGAQWRRWFPGGIDQIANLIHDLKTNPDSRRLMVNAWNVGELDSMVLPPCHYGFQVYTRELSETDGLKKINLVVKYKGNNCKIINCHNANPELLTLETPEGERIIYENQLDEPIDYSKFPTRAISLSWNQRSVDTFLGLPFNIASYGLLLEIIAKAVNMVPDELIGNLGDVHLYSNHIEQAKEQIGIELTDEDRYNIWFNNNYETGMEKFFDPNNLPNFEDSYYEPTPNRTREPYPLPKLVFGKTYEFFKSLGEDLSLITHLDSSDFEIEGYQSHPVIKAPLSN
jgi:thymidylate synthase